MGAVRVSFGEGISSQPESGPSQVMSGTPLRRHSFRRGGTTAHIGEYSSRPGRRPERYWRDCPREHYSQERRQGYGPKHVCPAPLVNQLGPEIDEMTIPSPKLTLTAPKNTVQFKEKSASQNLAYC